MPFSAMLTSYLPPSGECQLFARYLSIGVGRDRVGWSGGVVNLVLIAARSCTLISVYRFKSWFAKRTSVLNSSRLISTSWIRLSKNRSDSPCVKNTFGHSSGQESQRLSVPLNNPCSETQRWMLLSEGSPRAPRRANDKYKPESLSGKVYAFSSPLG